MIIGVPKEIKNNENRVGMTPAGVAELVKKGHTVYVQATAGANSGFSDDDYIAVGARILPAIEDVYAIADMIVKVKEPIAPEYKLIKKGQVVFTYFHFAADKLLTEAMIESGAVCIAYETVEKDDHSLPLLTPMSYPGGSPLSGKATRRKRKADGWRTGCPPRARTYFRWRRSRYQCRTNGCGNGCRGNDYGCQPATPALSQRGIAQKRKNTLFLASQYKNGTAYYRFGNRFRSYSR